VRTLAVDALRLAGARTAGGRVIEHLVREWSRMTIPFDRVVLLAPGDVVLPPLGDATPVASISFGRSLPLGVWEQLALPRRARGASVLFCPGYIAPLRHPGRLVVANHGIYERIPGEFSRLTRLRSTPLHRLSARRADRVIANSQQTKRDIAEFFDVPRERIDVVYPAAAEVFFEPQDPAGVAAEARRRIGDDAPYVIFVGKLSRRRHVPELIQAFAALRRRRDLPHRLVIVGPNTRDVDVEGIAQAHGVADRVVHIGHLEQPELARLYAGAAAFVLPTTYEGISYTMFEAMACGAPVLTVEHATVAEGAADAVLTVPSPEVDDIAAGLERLLEDRALATDLGRRGRAKAREFSWAATAADTVAILDGVAARRDGDA
jgi:glycosyltransferase involved in cell wall biosynthesis